MAEIVYVANDNVLELTGLKNAVADDYIDDATVTVTLVDSAGNEVAGETWPLIMGYVAASDGDYRVTLPYGLDLSAGRSYTAQITADGGLGLRGYWALPVHAKRRTS